MIRIVKTCPRCGCVVSDKAYEIKPVYEFIPEPQEEYCENCMAEYEALKCRQEEERRLFWEGDNGED